MLINNKLLGINTMTFINRHEKPAIKALLRKEGTINSGEAEEIHASLKVAMLLDINRMDTKAVGSVWRTKHRPLARLVAPQERGILLLGRQWHPFS